ncbi:radical SAM protein [Spirosoma sp. RP8]|uniref:Radical SAM protein n=1 Tax=Spirosoma liriopis TaxID=2937440 RepID=A0ABT0HIT0_9BACT|nr:radical SAM protein [Spirosoma liriopis]MCK8491495.1 radical SAM protein [Spirosoma liriopis]
MRIVSHPVLCNYYVTYRCNATCSFCDIWERPSPYVTLENARQNLRDLKKLGVRVVDFTGGEPLLHRQLPELLQEAKKLGLITTVTTNGLLYPKYAERLRGLVDMLHFSLDSPVAAEHDQSRGVRCFDKVMESIKLARQLGERPDILFTVFERNVSQIRQMRDEICLPNDLVLILNPVFDYNSVETGSLSNHALNELSWWGGQKNVYLNDAFVQLRLDGGNHIDKPVCKAGSTTLVISPENKLVLPCYHLGLKDFAIDGQLYDLYRSSEVQQLVALEGRLPACEGCVINCYMQPSFAVEVNKYWWKALPSTLKYNWVKGTWKQLF